MEPCPGPRFTYWQINNFGPKITPKTVKKDIINFVVTFDTFGRLYSWKWLGTILLLLAGYGQMYEIALLCCLAAGSRSLKFGSAVQGLIDLINSPFLCWFCHWLVAVHHYLPHPKDRGRYCFHKCLSVHRGGRGHTLEYPLPPSQRWGTPMTRDQVPSARDGVPPPTPG